jgi:hypothetical protein
MCFILKFAIIVIAVYELNKFKNVKFYFFINLKVRYKY